MPTDALDDVLAQHHRGADQLRGLLATIARRAEAHPRRGVWDHLTAGRLEAALADFDRALALDQSRGPALAGRAAVSQKMEKALR